MAGRAKRATAHTRKHDCPALAADSVIIYGNKAILIRRGNEPFKGMLALPGGFVEYGETVERAAIREALEETGLIVRVDSLLGVYSEPGRDPRGHTVSAVFLMKVVGGKLRAGDDAAGVELVPLKELGRRELAFDHRKILADAGLIG